MGTKIFLKTHIDNIKKDFRNGNRNQKTLVQRSLGDYGKRLKAVPAPRHRRGEFGRGAMNTSKSPWAKRKSSVFYRSPRLILIFFLSSLFLLLLLFTNPSNSFLYKTLNPQLSQCTRFQILTGGHRFLWYAPHSGFSNQLSEFKNAILMAAILNRTLIVPPILDHHAVSLGSCPKFRVLPPKDIRIAVWNHALELLQTGRYVSMVDVIDISSLLPSYIRVIDFRIFASLWCSTNTDLTCINDRNTFSRLKRCGSTLSGFDGNLDKCLYAVDEDCRTTVWTYGNGGTDGKLDSFQPDEQLQKKKNISYIRKRRDVYNTLGPGSDADSATVLAFGSLFTAPYKGSESFIDIHEAKSDPRIKSLTGKTKFLPFAPEILNAGKNFALETIKGPFLCAQLRLLDGQFKNHWKTTFAGLKQKLESLKQGGSWPINIFVMTDLPRSNWSGSYLGDLARESNRSKLYFLREEDDLVAQTAKKIGSISRSFNGVSKKKMRCTQRLPDVLLYIEESVCACASLGFVGTAGSTIAESIELMRKSDVCTML